MDFNGSYGYIYLLILMNISVAYAFVILAIFYSIFKSKLKPFEPVGKFLCIKFIIFLTFWQGVIISGMAKFGLLKSNDETPPQIFATQLQDFLICIEMLFVAIAHLYTFSYKPFIDEYKNFLMMIYEQHPNNNAISTIDIEKNVLQFSSNNKKTRHFKDEKRRIMRYPFSRLFNVSINKQSYPSNTSSINKNIECDDDKLERLLNNDNDFENHKSALKKYNLQNGNKFVHNGGYEMNDAKNSNNKMGIFSSNFATDSAIRDFNESMPVIVLPSNFKVMKGSVILSDPKERLKQLNDENNIS